MHKEIEIKYRLDSREALDRVIAVLKQRNFSISKTLAQENFFYDIADGSLTARHWAIRLRTQNHEHFLTVKASTADGRADEAVSVKLEYELPISHLLMQELQSGKKDFRDVLQNTPSADLITKNHVVENLRNVTGDEPLILKGSFKNTRRCIPVIIVGDNLVLELDATIFSKEETHFELEMEITNQAKIHDYQHYLKQLFYQAQVAFSTSSGKSERFFRLLGLGT